MSASPALLPLANDGSTLVLNLSGGKTSILHDTVSPEGSSLANRSYWLNVSVSVAAPSQSLQLNTSALLQWSRPGQIPEGADVLPPLVDWTWKVDEGGRDDSANWAWSPAFGSLQRSTTWVNASFHVQGQAKVSLSVTVDPTSPTGSNSPGIGYSLNSPVASGPAGLADPDLLPTAATLHPEIVRIGLAGFASTVTWNTSAGAPVFDFTQFDRAITFARNLSASVYLNIPAGSWGNGNSLPTGMPLNTSLPVAASSGTGYFPTTTAYASYVQAIAIHVSAAGEHVQYWNIGNEVPLLDPTEVGAFIGVFNVAASTIHLILPGALVGSDGMTDKGYEPTFAHAANSVGFLAFHYYPSDGICVLNGTYCPPTPGGAGSTDAQILFGGSNYSAQKFASPRSAQSLWHNLTGNWLPVFDAESNLNYAGGAATVSTGTDPRQQMLLGAVWTASVLIAGAMQNLAWFNYFNLQAPATTPATVTGALGGWGFGMTNEGTADNDLLYAPYWALALWGQNFGPGSEGVKVTPSDTGVARAWAVRNGTGLNVMVVNRANVPLVLQVQSLRSGPAPTTVEVLDDRSYSETFDAAAGAERLNHSGVLVAYRGPTNATTITLDGYGVAVIRFGNGSASPTTANPLEALGTPGLLGLFLLIGLAAVVVTVVVRRRRAHAVRGGPHVPPEGAVRTPPEPSLPADAPAAPFDPTAYDSDQLGRRK